MKSILLALLLVTSAQAHALAENCEQPPAELCVAKIREFVTAKFPTEKVGGDRLRIHSVDVRKSEYQGSTGQVDIEAYALFDEDGFTARRIFIGADGVVDQADKPTSCKNFRVKASYLDALAE